MREVAETGALTEDGAIANVGGGVKYWWRDQARGTFRKLGLRVEGRAALRSSGISLDQTIDARGPPCLPAVSSSASDSDGLMSQDSFKTRTTLTVGRDTFDYFSLPALEAAGLRRTSAGCRFR